jgi:hypothetical protein
MPAPPPAREQPQGNPYAPALPPPLIFEEFQGINTSTSRPGVPDEQMYWCDGFFPLDRQNLRTLYGIGASIYTPVGFVGSGATGHVTMTGFNIGSLSIANAGTVGQEFAANPGVGTFPLSFSGGGGSGAAGTATISIVSSHFVVTSVNLTSSGSGYTSTPSVTLTNNWNTFPGGVSPSFNAFLGTEQVATIVLDSGGSGYISPPQILIVGGGGAGAAAHATISGGAVNALILDNGGANYTSTPTVVVQAASTAGGIVYFNFANIGATPLLMVITADGSLWSVNLNTGVATVAGQAIIANPALGQMAITQWGSQYVIIVCNQTNGYFLWDGSVLYSPGGAAPPAIGGTMPTGIGGQAVETYNGQVWITSGASLTWSAPGTPVNFSTGAGGGNNTSTASYLRVGRIQPISSNGFLYLVNDSSIDYISGVSTSGVPLTTTFTLQNADPEVGSPWANSVNIWGGNIIAANPFGIQICYGSRVTKISDELDGVYNTVPNFANFQPSSAKAILFGKKVVMFLVPIIDPVSGQQVNKLLMWNGKRWWTSQQDVPLNFIRHQEINSVLTAYGTDGKSIYPLFAQPSINLKKTVQSKLWSAPGGYQFEKAAGRLWGLAQYYSFSSPNLNISIDNESSSNINTSTLALAPLTAKWTNASGTVVSWINASGMTVNWFINGSGIVVFPPTSVGQRGALTGLTVQTQAADMALTSLMLGDEVVAYLG